MQIFLLILAFQIPEAAALSTYEGFQAALSGETGWSRLFHLIQGQNQDLVFIPVKQNTISDPDNRAGECRQTFREQKI